VPWKASPEQEKEKEKETEKEKEQLNEADHSGQRNKEGGKIEQQESQSRVMGMENKISPGPSAQQAAAQKRAKAVEVS